MRRRCWFGLGYLGSVVLARYTCYRAFQRLSLGGRGGYLSWAYSMFCWFRGRRHGRAVQHIEFSIYEGAARGTRAVLVSLPSMDGWTVGAVATAAWHGAGDDGSFAL